MGGWLIFLAHGLVLASIPEVDCEPNNDEMWLGTLWLAFLDGLGVVLLGRGLAWRESLRWFALPAVPLALYDCWKIVPATASTTIGGVSLCLVVEGGVRVLEDFPVTPIQRVWPVLQILVLLAACWMAVRYWRPDRAT